MQALTLFYAHFFCFEAWQKTGSFFSPNEEAKRKVSEKTGIVINRMYVGDYLSSNLGHEIINLFQADNGCHYLYLNATGSFAAEHTDVGYMLMVKNGPKDCFEVIGMAKGLKFVPGVEEPRKRDLKESLPQISEKQKLFIQNQPEGDVKYGRISILDIFNKAEQQNVFITYKAKEVYVPKESVRVYLHYSQNSQNRSTKDGVFIAIREHNQPKTSLKSYIYPTLKSLEVSSASDYENLFINVINNDDLWSRQSVKKLSATNVLNQRDVSLFDICRIQDDENRISNAMAYFLRQPEYRGLWINFFKSIGISLESNYEVDREVSAKIEDAEIDSKSISSGGRIDLLIHDEKNLVVIENKIKSDINTIDSDEEGVSQLNRYVNYIEWLIESNKNKGKIQSSHFLVLAPNYNIPNLQGLMAEKYRLITYRDLYEYLISEGVDDQVEKDPNFKALRDVMFRHSETSPNGYLYNEMMEKFFQRLKELHSEIKPEDSIASIFHENNSTDKKDLTEEIENIRDKIEIEIYNQKPIEMAKKSAISGEYIITQEDNGSIRVCQIFDNVIDSLREASKTVGFKFDPNWNTRQFGKNLVKEYGDGSGNNATIGEYTIVIRDSGSVETYRVHGNTIATLRKIASENDFKPEANWNTRTLGSKLIDFVNGDYNPDEEIEEVAFVVSPKMRVKELQDNFKEMFGGHLRIKNGNKRCDEYVDNNNQFKEVLDASLAEIGCKAEGRFPVDMTVGEFQDKVKSECGVSVVVATTDDWVAVLPEFTLDGVNLIPKNTTKAKMQEMLAR